jgi:hypothetical protein
MLDLPKWQKYFFGCGNFFLELVVESIKISILEFPTHCELFLNNFLVWLGMTQNKIILLDKRSPTKTEINRAAEMTDIDTSV